MAVHCRSNCFTTFALGVEEVCSIMYWIIAKVNPSY
jgi:hypothetical protein